ncbi:hypothetical protein [Ligilactobacillus equi]|uniref:Fumarate reductase-succinate dehydrogenase flavoprotein domain-containing protein n=2 Tax=Ligilactobacillus equi TaxID=137357 RepID=V7HZ91_9LACO|nr:hypothetical protein [Ligilactobacillus equi]ETA74518.1 fumarate reductase-succinate dehydrogenase flavoprotein domain-containing protein [Ligilactobacillus equi DPC 6820]KRL84303.1 hypothetical protein FC36_GL000226 [Ligilactobacillus equi DSM 15833 = JCM 10991]
MKKRLKNKILTQLNRAELLQLTTFFKQKTSKLSHDNILRIKDLKKLEPGYLNSVVRNCYTTMGPTEKYRIRAIDKLIEKYYISGSVFKDDDIPF